jgi:hypothetical protein
MGHEHVSRALVERLQRRKTSSGTDHVLHHAPKAFDGVEVVPTMGREEVQAQLLVIVVKRRVTLRRPMDAAASDDQHDLLASVTTDMHDLMEIVAQLLGITMGHGRSLQLGEGGIAADIRYAFGTPMSCSKRSLMPDAMPQRQHTP